MPASFLTGMYYLNHWIPAFAGMTILFEFRLSPGDYSAAGRRSSTC